MYFLKVKKTIQAISQNNPIQKAYITFFNINFYYILKKGLQNYLFATTQMLRTLFTNPSKKERYSVML